MEFNEILLFMLGFMTERQALKRGFTMYGHYYFIPLWIKDEGESAVVAEKHLIFTPFMFLVTMIDMYIFHPIDGRGFMISIDGHIGDNDE